MWAVSIASLALPDLPGVSILRLMRTFRVLRLFSKLRSLRIIMNALAISMYPVFNTLLIVCLVLFVYAILGVQLYKEIDPEDFGSFADSVWTVPLPRRAAPGPTPQTPDLHLLSVLLARVRLERTADCLAAADVRGHHLRRVSLAAAPRPTRLGATVCQCCPSLPLTLRPQLYFAVGLER